MLIDTTPIAGALKQLQPSNCNKCDEPATSLCSTV